MGRILDRLTPQNSTGLPFIRLWDKVCTTIEGVFSDQGSQLATINAMLDPNTLTPVDKPIWMFFQSYLTGEQSALDAQATTYGITTEKTAYDAAITALTTYLATLTTPVLWNNTTGNTAIVGTTFRSKFTDVLTTKQALLNKMHGSAKTLADGAQTQANTATTNAASAQSTANTVTRNDKITGSWTVPANAVTATDAGSNVTITVVAHTRVYGDGSQVSVSGHTFTGLAYSTDYGIYYDDTTTSVTTPTYHTTTTVSNAQNAFVTGRHRVAVLTSPAAGGADVTGGSEPPGGGGDKRDLYTSL